MAEWKVQRTRKKPGHDEKRIMEYENDEDSSSCHWVSRDCTKKASEWNIKEIRTSTTLTQKTVLLGSERKSASIECPQAPRLAPLADFSLLPIPHLAANSQLVA